jgi:hypothetical protein
VSDLLVRIRSRTVFFLVGCFTICFIVKCLNKNETGDLLKSPSKNIPAFAYLLRARSSVVLR